MALTGRLGTPGSRLGYIALGVSYLPGGTGALNFWVHQITANQVRVYYNKSLTDTALDPDAYTLTSLAAPGTAVTPTIDEVVYFDEGQTAVILILGQPLTSGTDYSVEIDGVLSFDGDLAPPGGKNFTANVIDYPLILGAWQSKRDAIDILFDRSVGPTSTAATFEIRDAALPGPGVAMTQLVWAGEDIPETTLRIELPAGMPAANSYEIDFYGVEDESLNFLDGTVPLTLALRSSPPYSYTELRQLQITDAYVVDVETDFIHVATVRVYFNGPVIDSTIEINWAAYQSHVHLMTDDGDEITSPNASSIPSLITLSNEAKARFNAHRIRYGIHPTNDTVNAITAPDAFDIISVYTLINDIQTQYIAHLEQLHVHVYEDQIYNTINYFDVSGNYALAVSIMNTFKIKFNDHVLLDEYTMSISSAYNSTPVGKISDFCRFGIADKNFGIQGPYSLFADLHLIMDSVVPSVRIEASLTSEDGGSTTNPTDYTGSITARPAIAPAQASSTLVIPNVGPITKFDRQIILLGSNFLEISDSDNKTILSKPRVTTSLPALMWAFNNVVHGYYWHRSTPSGAHQVNDATIVDFNDYATLPLSMFITKANDFKTKINNHLTSDYYHYHADTPVTALDATDEESLITLVSDIQKTCADHFDKVGPHFTPTFHYITAPINDTVVMDTHQMVNGENYVIFGAVQDVYRDNHAGETFIGSFVTLKTGGYFYNTTSINLGFVGVASRPSVASAIPKLALVVVGNNLRLESDTVEVFFSKPMEKTPINSSNLLITGGSILTGEMTWADQFRATIQVRNMENVAYAVTASSIRDVAGNPII